MLTDLVIAEPPVGWARTQLDPLRLELARIGLTLHYLRRDWDTQFWPHAQRGFFALKKKLPAILDRLELTG
jgi:deoxyribodipyrimidine photo-lyase